MVPSGDITISIGDADAITIPFSAITIVSGTSDFSISSGSVIGINSFSVSNTKKSFTLSTGVLANTGIPIAGTGGIKHLLPIRFDIVTVEGTRTFETVVEISRKSVESGSWK